MIVRPWEANHSFVRGVASVFCPSKGMSVDRVADGIRAGSFEEKTAITR